MLGESIVNDRNDRNDEPGILEGMMEDPCWWADICLCVLGNKQLSSRRAEKDVGAFSLPSSSLSGRLMIELTSPRIFNIRFRFD